MNFRSPLEKFSTAFGTAAAPALVLCFAVALVVGLQGCGKNAVGSGDPGSPSVDSSASHSGPGPIGGPSAPQPAPQGTTPPTVVVEPSAPGPDSGASENSGAGPEAPTGGTSPASGANANPGNTAGADPISVPIEMPSPAPSASPLPPPLNPGDGSTPPTFTIPGVGDGIAKQIPTLAWAEKGEKLGKDQVTEKLRETYPDASPVAISGMTDVLMKFDREFVSGNHDGTLDRKELVMPGIIMGALQDMDFSHGIPVQGAITPERGLELEEIERKINKQIFGRYKNAYDYKMLSQADLTLEWIQFGLKYYLVDQLVRHYGGNIDEASQVRALTDYGIWYVSSRPDGWLKLRRLYDSPAMGGNGDHQLNQLEFLNLVTDLEYSSQFMAATNYSMTLDNLKQRWDLYYHLKTVYPRVGENLFFKGPADPRPQYWYTAIDFDKPDHGGNGSKNLDAGEVTYMFGYASVLEHVFALYDANRDGKIEKPEAEAMLSQFPGMDKKKIGYLFKEAAADVDLSKPGWLDEIDLVLSPSLDALGPFDVYVRVSKLFPKYLPQ